MYNDYYLLKRVEEEKGAVEYASVQDSFTYMGEVVETPNDNDSMSEVSSTGYLGNQLPKVGDKVIFLKGSGEDIGDLKAVKFEDIIKKA